MGQDTTERECCCVPNNESPCRKPAEFEVICDNGDPYAVTDTCAEHLAEMLCGDHAHTVVHIP